MAKNKNVRVHGGDGDDKRISVFSSGIVLSYTQDGCRARTAALTKKYRYVSLIAKEDAVIVSAFCHLCSFCL